MEGVFFQQKHGCKKKHGNFQGSLDYPNFGGESNKQQIYGNLEGFRAEEVWLP